MKTPAFAAQHQPHNTTKEHRTQVLDPINHPVEILLIVIRVLGKPRATDLLS